MEIILDLTSKIFFIVLLIFAGAFFSFAEISITGARKVRLDQMIENGDERAKKVLDLQRKPGKFFSVIQIGTNAVAILGGIIGDAAFSSSFEILLKPYIPEVYLSSVSFLISFFLVTLSFVLFADLIPRRISLTNPESISIRIVGATYLLSILLKPLVWFLSSLSTAILKFLGISTIREDKLTSDDIVATVDAGAAMGVLDPSEQAAIENVIGLDNRLVSSSMTQRDDIIYLTLDESVEDIKKKLTEFPHDKYLVCDKDIDHVVGCVNSKDLLSKIIEGKLVSLKEPGLIKKVLPIPDTISLSEALDIFKGKHAKVAIVINEYALTVGLINITDILYTVMGDFLSNQDDGQIVQRDNGTWLVAGSTPIDDLERAFDIDKFPDDEAYETLAGFMMYMLRHVPKVTDVVNYAGYRFEVIDVDCRRIDKILVSRAHNTEEETDNL